MKSKRKRTESQPKRKQSLPYLLTMLFIWCALILVPCGLYILFLNGIYTQSLYPDAEVQRMCEVFHVRADDPFCSDPTRQSGWTLQAMLERNFPVGVTTYADINPLLESVKSTPSRWCTSNDRSHYLPKNCPLPDRCGANDYSCEFDFGGDVGHVEVYFSYLTGAVINYLVDKPDDWWLRD